MFALKGTGLLRFDSKVTPRVNRTRPGVFVFCLVVLIIDSTVLIHYNWITSHYSM